jgi:RNA polymerase sigma factor (TIGR02999 family)
MENRKASDAMLQLVYDDLRRLAFSKMKSQPADHTLQATALVHEAWIKISSDEERTWKNRRHFFATAAEAMRQILVDRARRKQRAKHGGRADRVNMEPDHIHYPFAANDEHLLLVHESLDRFASEHPEKAEVVRLRYFVGLNHAETAELLRVSEKTIKRYWAYAKAWLCEDIESHQKVEA